MEVTLGILEKEGFSGVTMQKIADQAGINVAAVYGYFPNKYQVIAELNDRMFNARSQMRSRHYERLLGMDGNWADNLADSLYKLAEWRSSQRGLAALSNAMRSSPELWQLTRENSDKSTEQLTAYLSKADPDFKGDQQARARMLAEAFISVLDLIQMSDGALPASMLDELVEMIRRYLKNA